MTEKYDTISPSTTDKMAQRPRLAIDVDPMLHLKLNGAAAEQSIKQQRRVTVKELVLSAVADKYPDLAKAIKEELS